ncbi:unnamed protein product [Cyclocybe aegerita]|uniref:Arrestin-like N-terminal domain-containing protein n=1 Tax=Cyclocybe aegerita TaxID=1973307 RepID=A0A8S0WCW5_CYCAE|nr:unnamed protein product [Cyclocybe aegerita]
MHTSSSSSSPSDAPGSGSVGQRFYSSRRFSTSSLATVDTYHTSLPQYSATVHPDQAWCPPSFPDSRVLVEDHLDATSPPPFTPTPSARPFLAHPTAASTSTKPRRHSYINPRYSTIPPSLVENPGLRPNGYEFDYIFPIRSHKPWATLHLFTRGSIPGNPHPSDRRPKTPSFWGNELLAGMVELDLEVPQSIQEINIKGKVVTGSLEGSSYTFFNHDHVVWTKPPKDHDASERQDGKLFGECKYPFSFPFPTHVDLSTRAAVVRPDPAVGASEQASVPETSSSSSLLDKGKKKSRPWSINFNLFSSPLGDNNAGTLSRKKRNRLSNLPQQMINSTDEQGTATFVCPIPQSFAEGSVMASVDYELAVHIVHSRFRPDSKIKTNISYVPTLMPPPASSKRQQAYQAAAALPGPMADPDGWLELPKVVVKGFFGEVDARHVEIDCMLHLAQPFSYTRGTVIPCYLTLTSQDSQALKALSKPKAPYLRLVRRIRHMTLPGANGTSLIQDPRGISPVQGTSSFGMVPSIQGILPPTIGDTGKGAEMKTAVHEIAVANWWLPPKDVPQQTHIRHLEGEIHLSEDLQPSCACTIFSIEYFVELLPLRSGIFEVDPVPGGKGLAKKQVISSHPIDIATLYRPDGPLPVAFTEAPKSKVRSLTVDTIYEQFDEY